MRLGFLTACLPKHSLKQIADWASQTGFQALEVAAWPDLGDRPFVASHIAVGKAHRREAEEARAILDDKGIVLSSLAYYDNNLHPDPQVRTAVNDHLVACVETASRIGCPTVGTFIGRDPYKSVSDNLCDAERIFRPIVERAEGLGVHVVIENCVMEGWHPDGYPGNLAYSPELWDWLISLGLYLNFDPSHLVWIGIDPVTALRPYVPHVAHAQAKDIETFPWKRNRYGYLGKAVERDDPWDVGWWRYRVPGLGEVDWKRIVDVLYEGGFDGVLSVEHEDPVWGGSADLVMSGLEIARRTLGPLILPSPSAPPTVTGRAEA